MSNTRRTCIAFLLLITVTILLNVTLPQMILRRVSLAVKRSNSTNKGAAELFSDHSPTRFISDGSVIGDTLATVTRSSETIVRTDWWCSGHLDPFIKPSKQPPRKGASSANNDKNTRFFLTAVLVVRIYTSDKNQLTTREFVQWLQYLSWAGVEHVYVYDSYHHKSEAQRENLRCFSQNGFVTYVDWSHRVKRNISGLQRARITQRPAYQNCLNKYGHEFTWQTAIDIDEYPYSSEDQASGFLRRVVKKITREQTQNVGQIFMRNYLFLGEPRNITQHPLLIDRFLRGTKKPWDYSTRKPIFLSQAVQRAVVHKNRLRKGYTEFFPESHLLRMNHYHGKRHQSLTKADLQNLTQWDLGMQTAVSAMQRCHHVCYLGCC